MSVTVRIPGFLRTFTEGQGEVTLDGSPATVGEALTMLWTRHPGVRDRVLTERGEVRQHVNVFVGDESIRYTGGLATPMPEGGRVFIIPAVSGG
jgi:sulfur-carrier protein